MPEPRPHTSLPDDDPELFHLLVDRVRDYAIFLIDPEGHVASWNAGAKLLKGYTSQEIIGHSIERFYSPEDRAAGTPKRLLEKAKTDGRVETEGWRYRKDGSRFWADAIITALRDSDGRLRGFAKVTRDLTEKRAAAQALQKAHADLALRVEELARSNADLEQFAYVASHDLQEPLRMIMTHVQLLVEEYGEHLKGPAQEYIDFVLDGGRRMQRLIRDLLTYSRVVRSDEMFSAVHCETILRQAVQNLDALIVETGANITYDALPTITGVATQFVQLFQNLIGNAMKFRRAAERPTIHISASHSGDEWTLRFTDNGIGIDRRYADEIFKPFRRLHGTSQYPGSGIGLAICHKVVTYHGGRIWVESDPGRGSTFLVALKESGPGGWKT